MEIERRILAKHEDLTLVRYTNTKVEQLNLLLEEAIRSIPLPSQLHHHYLEHCRKWPYYGATFYEGALRNKLQRSLSDVVVSASVHVCQLKPHPLTSDSHQEEGWLVEGDR